MRKPNLFFLNPSHDEPDRPPCATRHCSRVRKPGTLRQRGEHALDLAALLWVGKPADRGGEGVGKATLQARSGRPVQAQKHARFGTLARRDFGKIVFENYQASPLRQGGIGLAELCNTPTERGRCRTRLCRFAPVNNMPCEVCVSVNCDREVRVRDRIVQPKFKAYVSRRGRRQLVGDSEHTFPPPTGEERGRKQQMQPTQNRSTRRGVCRC